MNLIDLHTFVLVAERGTLSAAARELGVPKSTVSRRVQRLEDELGVALVRRTSRSVALTDRGAALMARSAAAFRQLEDAGREVVELDEEPSGVLRLTAPGDLGSAGRVTEMLAAFRARWPAVRLEVELTPRLVDLVHEGVDVALRPATDGGPVVGEGVTARRLVAVHAELYAAPAYLERRGTPTTPGELSDHDWVAHTVLFRRGVRLTHRDTGEEVTLNVQPVVTSNDIAQIHGLVLAGAGIGVVPALITEGDCATRRLVPLLPDWSIPGGRLYALWPTTRHLSPRVRAFVDFAAAWFAADGTPPSG